MSMTVTPHLEDRVLFMSTNGQGLKAADVTAVLAPALGIQRVSLHVWGTWPPEDETAYDVAVSGQALDILGIAVILPGTWRSIEEVPTWRSLIS